MPLDERAFFSERPETRPAKFACPRCRRTNEYTVRWTRRSKKDRLPGGADERDRAKFAKVRDHLLRLDDELVCKSCGKKFEIPSLHSLLFVDQLEGLPKDDEVDDELSADGSRPADGDALTDEGKPAEKRDPRAHLPARFRRTTSWRG
ncbi:MAG: hypothetical protein ABR606_15170 [Vicinamibacterales bacterium]